MARARSVFSSATACSPPSSCPTTLSWPCLEHLLSGMLWSLLQLLWVQIMLEDNQGVLAGKVSLVVFFLESLRRCQRDPAGADGMSPLSCHPSVFAPRCSRLECAPTEPSLALLCMFLAETWRSLRVVFLKKMLRNIVSSNLSIHFHCHLQTCFEDKSGIYPGRINGRAILCPGHNTLLFELPRQCLLSCFQVAGAV